MIALNFLIVAFEILTYDFFQLYGNNALHKISLA